MWLEGRETRKPPIKNESALSFFKVITYTMKKVAPKGEHVSLLYKEFIAVFVIMAQYVFMMP